MEDQVKAWVQDVTIPTYGTGKPDKNPMFLEKRVYQGSSGVVYPHAVIEKIEDDKKDQVYQAVFIENRYIKIMVLPQLGGRIQMAYDKVKQRHFVYYNQVIKPALVGLTGPWISGGIEFNWPQHHRPSTFEPVDFTIEENIDGSKTVWVNEVEIMFHTKGMAGFTLHPGKAYLEINGRLYNRTPLPQTFLWWANPAVKVNDHYQSVFPPDVYAVFDHGKRDVSSFPIAKGTYYKVDYSPGTDISRYRNIPVPTSYMAVASRYNFIGGYEHDTKGGLLHVANHHISPGKKQWTWGNGDFGQAWDRNLTDEDGPYIELMTGVYTDNQPDFTWIQPYEEKTFVQYFMPYTEVGMVKNATKEAIAGLEIDQHEITVNLYTTAEYTVQIQLLNGETELFATSVDCSPEQPYTGKVTLPQGVDEHMLTLSVTDESTGRTLVTYANERPEQKEIPVAAAAAKRPADIENNEQLFLTGLHIEQYRHATYNARDYYEEALKRDPKDIRNNNALGLWYLRRGKFKMAESLFSEAIKTATQRNPNPYDGEPYYNLGIALKMQRLYNAAYDAFYKAIWNDAWQHAGYLQLARLSILSGNDAHALELVEKSIIRNYHSHSARHIKVIVFRRLKRYEEAFSFAKDSLTIDPFNFGCLYEEHILNKELNRKEDANDCLALLKNISRNWVQNFIAYALDYAEAGLYEDAINLLLIYLQDATAPYPMVCYYIAWCYEQLNKKEEAGAWCLRASALKPDYCFPNRIADIPVLETAMQLNPVDSYAPYYLGNLWYDKRQYADAIHCWENAVELNKTFPTAWRNLALAYYNKLNEPAKSLNAMKQAFECDNTDARILMELDQLYRKLNTDLQFRLELLNKYRDLVESRDDLYLEYITLQNLIGQHSIAASLLSLHNFHPWEGGEGKVVGQYRTANIELAKEAITIQQYEKALELLQLASGYPSNLGEGKLFGSPENDIDYLKGVALDRMDKTEEAQRCFINATNGVSEPVQAIFYNDPQPDKIFYQGLAWLKLNSTDKAQHIFSKLIEFGKAHMNDNISIDYFAVSLPDLLVFDTDLNLRNKIHCLYMIGLGCLGLGNNTPEDADTYFNKVLELDVSHQGAIVHHKMKQHARL